MEIVWLSFDDTVPVPALASPLALRRDAVLDLFHSGRELTRSQWLPEGVLVRPEDGSWADAVGCPRITVGGIEFFDFSGAGHEYNDDTDRMIELGYRTHFVPGGGLVVESPDTPAVLAAAAIIDELQQSFGTLVPGRLNSWAEYAAAVLSVDRVFALAGVRRNEREKQRMVASMVDDFLSGWAAHLPTDGTVRADQMPVNTVLESVDVRWWPQSPEREVFVVTEVESAEDGMLAVTFSTKYGIEHKRLVRPDRRFLVAVQ